MESASPSEPRTLFDKLWDAHIVTPESHEAPAMLYVDLHLLHEVTSPQAFAMLDERGAESACAAAHFRHARPFHTHHTAPEGPAPDLYQPGGQGAGGAAGGKTVPATAFHWPAGAVLTGALSMSWGRSWA